MPGAVALHVRGSGLRGAARVVVNQAKAAAVFMDQSGRLRKSIKVQKRAGYVVLQSGARQKVFGVAARATAGGAGARQAHLVEAGHGGPKPARPHPFMLPAFEATTSAQLTAGIAAMQKVFGRTVTQLRAGRAGRTVTRLAGTDVQSLQVFGTSGRRRRR